MKHLLNDLSSEERNRILEQYDNSLIVETSKFNKLMNSKLGNVRPLVEREGDDLMGQMMRDTHSPYEDPMDEFPYEEPMDEFPSVEKDAPIHKVFDMETGKFVGTHQYGVGFEPNKIGMEMGYKADETSIPDGTRMEKRNRFSEF